MLSSTSSASNSPHKFSFFSRPKTTSLTTPRVVVTTRVVTVQRPAVTPKPVAPTSAAPPKAHSVAQETPAPKISTTKTQKRKRPAQDSDADARPSVAKRARGRVAHAPTPSPSTDSSRSSTRERSSLTPGASSASSSRASTRFRTSPPTSEALYRSSRSRSVSVLANIDQPIERDCYLNETHASEEGFMSCELVVESLMKSYKAFFKNPEDPTDTSFEPHPTDYPVAELEFPNTGASERYILLAPKDKDHYNPIMCLEKSLYTIIDNYLTPEQQALFGTTYSDIAPPSPNPLDNSSPRVNHLRNLQRAIHKRDGPLFVATLNDINALLRTFKYPPLPADIFEPPAPNALREAVRTWQPTGMPTPVVHRIIDETYQRTVGPRTHELTRYAAFSSTVYGELMPTLVSDIIRLARLRPGSLLVDLGSGVGNIVLQAALQSGCDAFGVEVMPAPASIAREQLEQMRMRARMWGVAMGKVELEEGDMLESKRVSELMSKADVVLINNKVFSESLNEAIRPKFLDLKEGALVVSLKPFVAGSALNARLTERNIDDISAIFDVSEQPYHSGAVSWGSGSGSYYVHRVDREGYKAIRERFESQRSRSVRSRR
ncbi:DOT1-domain-containing protein [Dentipellis sp. KUC8613]|nr:DOT1-domain-containing protein [Dentipellis sp. KUC8613]